MKRDMELNKGLKELKEITHKPENVAGAPLTMYNHCLRCNRKIKAPQTMGRVCLRKTKEADVKNDEPAPLIINDRVQA
jgi:hypothetical protein